MIFTFDLCLIATNTFYECHIYVISSCKNNVSRINRLDLGGGGHLPAIEQYQRLSGCGGGYLPVTEQYQRLSDCGGGALTRNRTVSAFLRLQGE